MKYTLSTPVQNGSETVTEITLREKVTTGDLRDVSLSSLVGEVRGGEIEKLIGRLSGQPDNVVSKLSARDCLKLAELILGFLDLGPRTGDAG